MQFSAAENRFIVKTKLNSTFTNDLKRKYFFFRKMFIVTDLVTLRSWLLSVVTTSSAMPGCHAENRNFWSMGFGLHDSISEYHLFLTSAIEIIVCQNPGAMHESMLSDVHIGEKVPLHKNGVTTFAIHVINVMFRHSNN